jgi:hypothetical protein
METPRRDATVHESQRLFERLAAGDVAGVSLCEIGQTRTACPELI